MQLPTPECFNPYNTGVQRPSRKQGTSNTMQELFKDFLFEGLSDRQRARTKSSILNLLTHSPNGYNIWNCAQVKPGAQNSIPLSHMGCRDPTTAAIRCWLPWCGLAGSWNQASSWDSLRHPDRHYRYAESHLGHCAKS